MRNKLSFDLQLSARKAAIAERIAAHKIARSKVSVFLMAMSAGVFMAIGFTFYLSVIADAPSSQALTHLVGGLALHSALFAGGLRHQPVHLVGNDGDGKKSGRY
ncbi:formate transporter FocB [Escherichia coli]|uniref:Formate transporter FocB n=1 Tax=Escherichia coli TaxID=562 RepID=A0A2X1NNR4_ECOLX|nr:formate transporter FocB [Escherichia coli]